MHIRQHLIRGTALVAIVGTSMLAASYLGRRDDLADSQARAAYLDGVNRAVASARMAPASITFGRQEIADGAPAQFARDELVRNGFDGPYLRDGVELLAAKTKTYRVPGYSDTFALEGPDLSDKKHGPDGVFGESASPFSGLQR